MVEDFNIKMYKEIKRNKIDEYLDVEKDKRVRQLESIREYSDDIQYDNPSLVE